MKTYYHKTVLSMAIAFTCSLLFFPQAVPAQDKSLEQRISIVESRTTELEHKVGELQKSINQLTQGTAKSSTTISKGNWKNIENWRSGLQKGMTKKQVQELMGDPAKTETYTMLGEDWLYGLQGSGEIHFSPKGILESWKEPIPDDLK